MRKMNMLIILICIILTGCGTNNSISEQPVELEWDLEIPVKDGAVFTMRIPMEYGVIETDNYIYWKLSNNVTIYCTESINHLTAEYDENTELYTTTNSVSRDFDDRSIVLKVPSGVDLSTYSECMKFGSIENKDTSLYKERKIKTLPDYMDKSSDMSLTDSNLYMPIEIKESVLQVYKSSLLCDGADYIESWIQDGTLEEIEDKLVTIVLSNNADVVDRWYLSDDTFYVESGNRYVIAKKLKYNEWYVYSCTSKYLDYALTGASKVHSGNTNTVE